MAGDFVAEGAAHYARRMASKHGQTENDIEMHRAPHAPHHTHRSEGAKSWSPFSPAQPEWIAGKGEEERYVSIFVWHPNLKQNLKDNPLFVVQAAELLWAMTMAIIGMLMISDIGAINHYAFIIAYSIIFAFFILVHFMSVWYWARQTRYSHRHNNEVQFAYFFFIAIYGVVVVLIGRWLNRNPGSCCGFQASQPDESDPVTYNRYLMAYGFLLSGSVFMLFLLTRALDSHRHPEGRYVPSFDNSATTDIYIDYKDTPEERKFLTTAAAGRAATAQGHHHGSGKRRANKSVPRAAGVPMGGDASSVFPSAHGAAARRPEPEMAWGRVDS